MLRSRRSSPPTTRWSAPTRPWPTGSTPASLGFENVGDPNELVEWNDEEWPQAGILSTPVYNNRYPNTPTNRNRMRSRIFYEFFGAEDVQRLAARPIDVNSVQSTNPTLFDNKCTICHDFVDPVAGGFQNYDFNGVYRPYGEGEGWYGDMVPPGFRGTEIPLDQAPLPWLASTVTARQRVRAVGGPHTCTRA